MFYVLVFFISTCCFVRNNKWTCAWYFNVTGETDGRTDGRTDNISVAIPSSAVKSAQYDMNKLKMLLLVTKQGRQLRKKLVTETNTNLRWIRNWRTLLHMHRADAVCALTRWLHFSAWNDVMAAILKLIWCLSNRNFDSVNRCVYLLEEEHPCRLSSRSDLKRRSIKLFWRGRPIKKNDKNKMSSDMRSAPDPERKHYEVQNSRHNIYNTAVLLLHLVKFFSNFIFLHCYHFMVNKILCVTVCDRASPRR